MENNLELLFDSDELAYYRYQMPDIKIILLFDKATNDLYLNLSDMARLLYYSDEKAMLSSDVALDILNDIKKKTGKFPIMDNLASVSLLRKIPLNENKL